MIDKIKNITIRKIFILYFVCMGLVIIGLLIPFTINDKLHYAYRISISGERLVTDDDDVFNINEDSKYEGNPITGKVKLKKAIFYTDRSTGDVIDVFDVKDEMVVGIVFFKFGVVGFPPSDFTVFSFIYMFLVFIFGVIFFAINMSELRWLNFITIDSYNKRIVWSSLLIYSLLVVILIPIYLLSSFGLWSILVSVPLFLVTYKQLIPLGELLEKKLYRKEIIDEKIQILEENYNKMLTSWEDLEQK